jgi:hypothetical protein
VFRSSPENWEAAHGVLQQFAIVKLISDISALLDPMAATHAPQLSQPNYESILKHLTSGLDESNSQDNIRHLRNLPLFPLLTSTMSGSVVTNWAAIPAGHLIRSVGRPKFVPVVDIISFVGLDSISLALVNFLGRRTTSLSWLLKTSQHNPTICNSPSYVTSPQIIIHKKLSSLQKTVYVMFLVRS